MLCHVMTLTRISIFVVLNFPTLLCYPVTAHRRVERFSPSFLLQAETGHSIDSQTKYHNCTKLQHSC